MKKLIFALFGLVLLSGCKTSQKVVERSKPEPQKLETQKPIVWKTSIYEKIAVGDKIFFFNSSEITVDGDFLNQSFLLDGAINQFDSTLNVIKKVPMLTPGVVILIKRGSNGQILDMIVSHDNNDATYIFDYHLRSDGAFFLNGNAKLIFRGKEYKVTATINADCVLMVIYNYYKTEETIVEEAKGAILPNKN